jgi:hypothetical protein
MSNPKKPKLALRSRISTRGRFEITRTFPMLRSLKSADGYINEWQPLMDPLQYKKIRKPEST